MPELPEVETIVRQLARVLPGKVIASVEALKEKSLRGQVLEVVGRRIERVERKQKIIVMKLSGEMVLLVHLKMTGQLIYLDDSKRVVGGHPTHDWVGMLPSKHTRVMVHFNDGSHLYFNDQRVFGWVKIVNSKQWGELSQRMPPDVVDDAFTVDYLTHVLKRSSRAVKLVILDQNKMGGMGNIYACDGLYLAGIDPSKKANTLPLSAVKKLHGSMRAVLTKGIEAGGASYSHFVDTKGLGGHYQDHFMVYDRAGEPCRVCGSLIEKTSLGGRGTYFCSKCQR